MGLLPKIAFALMLLLPGGFVIGPAVLLLKRWRDHRRSGGLQSGVRAVAAALPSKTAA